MNTFIVALMKAPDIAVVDTVTKLSAAHRHCVLVGASHCGIYAVYLAAGAGVRALILTDAGVGLADAGIGGLAWAEACSLPAAAADYRTCRIADGADVMASGVISHVNRAAADLGCRPGMAVADCAGMMRNAKIVERRLPDYGEARFAIEPKAGEIDIIGCDSLSLLIAEDAGRIAVTASHGALLGGLINDGAVDMALAGATFSDAGIGKDEAGVARLAVLDDRGVPAAAIDAMTARIGDARSNWQTGVLSRVNARARAAGIETGMTTREFAARLRANARL